MNKPAFILDPTQHISLTFDDGLMETIYASDDRFINLLESIKAEDWNAVRDIVTKTAKVIEESITEATVQTGERVCIEHGVVYVDGMPMHTTLTNRLLTMLEAGFNVEPMIQFLKNLAENPSFRAVHELYDFMEASSLPITDDGHFLAYKKIRADWTDVHSGKMDNSIGATVSMPRYQVDDNRNQTCSSGLHFCSRDYLNSFGGQRVVVVKINPRDVVSIPSDYNDSKGRACQYVVVQELHDATNQQLEAMPAAVDREEGKEVIQRCDAEDGTVLQEYDTIELAAEDTNLRVEYIERVLSGDRKSTGGFGWKKHTTEAISYDLSSASYTRNEWEEDDFDDDEDEDGYSW